MARKPVHPSTFSLAQLDANCKRNLQNAEALPSGPKAPLYRVYYLNLVKYTCLPLPAPPET